ncbi:hypothetical protein LCGC14_3154910, partial [marine sediment metagenome]
MAWVTPSTHVAGYLVTSDDWNEVINNLKHLRGQDGTTVLEGDVDPDGSGDQDLGSASKLWDDGWFDKLYVSSGLMTLHRGTVRQVQVLWDHADPAQMQLASGNTGSGDRNPGGTGQWVLSVRENAGDMFYFGQQGEQSSAANAARRCENGPGIALRTLGQRHGSTRQRHLSS